MNKKSRITVLLISLIFCLSAFSITAFAEDYTDNVPIQDDTVYVPEEPVTDYVPEEPVTEYVPDETEAPYTEPVYDYTEPATEYSPDTVDGNGDNEGGYTEDNTSEDYVSDYSYDEYVPDFEDDEYDFGEVQEVSEAELYDVDKKIDDSELSAGDWESIAKSLQNASNSGGGSDFSAIKNNTSTEDNGLWMLITGALLIILAIVGITYVIISSMNAKKAYASSGGGHSGRGGAHSSGGTGQRSRSDYNDGYGAPRIAKRKKRDDTAEVRLPKNSGGNRYK